VFDNGPGAQAARAGEGVRVKKHLKYLSYVMRHRWYVFVECCKLGIVWRGITHDLSKFLPDEWFAYADYFYGDESKWPEGSVGRRQEKFLRQMRFDKAWLLHQHRNPHHWQYWRLREDDGGTKLIEMPRGYVLEMLADWRGAGRAQGFEEIGPWYSKNKEKIELLSCTRNLLHAHMTLRELKERGSDGNS
jgi:hypothetical protein